MTVIGGGSASESKFEFLQLLVAQLQNQDPLEPVNQEDFMQQLASFSTLEELEGLNVRFDEMLKVQELSQGFELVGKQVRYLEGNELAVGEVTEVSFLDGQVVAIVNERGVPISNITSVIA